MAFSDLWSRKGKAPESENSSKSLDDLLAYHELLYVSDEPGKQFAVVTTKSQPLPGEFGTTSPSPWTSHVRKEYNLKLQGLAGLEAYDKMRKSDGTVRGTLRLVKTPVLSARWFMEPGGDRPKDKKAAEFVWHNLTGGVMSIGWSQILQEALLMLDFGYYMFEKVYDERDLRKYGSRNIWRKFAPRHPMDVDRWVFDENGGPVGVWMNSQPASDLDDARRSDLFGSGPNSSSPYPGMTNVPSNGVSGIPGIANYADEHKVFIPIEKLVVFTFDREAGNIEGTSVLRSAYKHWFYKEQLYKIDAIQKERHGIGIPVIKLPMGYKEDDKRAAEELGRNIRTNERAHITLPPGWEIFMLKLEGNPVDCLDSIKHHDLEIEKNIVAYFLNDAQNSANAEVLNDVFLKAVRFVADIICEGFNTYCIPQLVEYNYPGAEYPKLKARRIGESADWRTLSFALRNLIGAGVIRPDDVLEESMREEMDLPDVDIETVRKVVTPQSGPNGDDDEDDDGRGNGPQPPKPPRVGPPRQAPVGKQENTRGLPRGNAGQDRSGG